MSVNHLDIQYMFQNNWTEDYVELYDATKRMEKEPYFTAVDDAVILPTKSTKGFSWGLGGVLDCDGEFVEESAVGYNAFGGGYPYSKDREEILHETVVFIGIVPKHWGHFLIDTVARLWYSVEHKDIKVAFCGWNWGENRISGNYLEFFRLLGFREEQLLMIMAPTRFDRVIIPSATMGYACGYREEYLQVVRAVVEAALEQGNEKNFPIYKNIYFTRTQFRKSQKNEVGEKAIESVFEKVGFTVLSPEKLSLIEQIFYIHNCNVMVCMTGTIPHNAIFAGKTTQVVLLNRTCKTNPPQVAINKMTGVDVVYIDVYTKQILKHPRDYGGKNGGPIWVEVNNNLKRYLEDSGYSFPKSGNWNSATRKLKDTLYFEVLSCLKVIKNYLVGCSVYQKFKGLAKKKR